MLRITSLYLKKFNFLWQVCFCESLRDAPGHPSLVLRRVPLTSAAVPRPSALLSLPPYQMHPSHWALWTRAKLSKLLASLTPFTRKNLPGECASVLGLQSWTRKACPFSWPWFVLSPFLPCLFILSPAAFSALSRQAPRRRL